VANKMRPIGYSGVDGRGGAFKLAVRRVGERWFLYMGHLWHSGWTILDVTNPKDPKFVKFIPGPDNTWTIQMEFHDNIMLTALARKVPVWGGDPKRPHDEGVLIWDISDPVNWKQLGHWKTGSTGVHRVGYPGGKYASLAARMPGYRGQILVFLDISDPANPKEAGRWWMPGQKEGEEPAREDISFHGPAIISDDGKTAYLGYGPAVVILDISDIAMPKPIGQLTISPPFGALVAHDVLPIPGKNMLYVHGEATGGGDAPNGALACSSPFTISGMSTLRIRRSHGSCRFSPSRRLPKACRTPISAKRGGVSGRTIRTSNIICPTSRSRATLSTSPTSMRDYAPTTSRTRGCRRRSVGSFRQPRPSATARCRMTSS
jgi:hypothetical protein